MDRITLQRAGLAPSGLIICKSTTGQTVQRGNSTRLRPNLLNSAGSIILLVLSVLGFLGFKGYKHFKGKM